MADQSDKPNDIEALRRQIAEFEARLAAAQNATLTGTGAITQGDGDAFGERSVKTGGNSGTIITGTQIVQHYHAASNRPLPKDEIARQVAGYLGWLQAQTQSIELRGIERAGGAPVVLLPLETAYVPLRAKSLPRIGDTVEGKPVRQRTRNSSYTKNGHRLPFQSAQWG